MPFLLQVITVKKNAVPFTCDLSACTAQADLRYSIILLSVYSKLLVFRFTQPNSQYSILFGGGWG